MVFSLSVAKRARAFPWPSCSPGARKRRRRDDGRVYFLPVEPVREPRHDDEGEGEP